MANRILYEELKDWDRKNETHLAEEFDGVYKTSLDIWKEEYMREYTTHGKEHTDQVEENLGNITRPIQEQKSEDLRLTGEEIFVLLSACCLHDIGMQLPDEPDARAKHAQAAYELILKEYSLIGTRERYVSLPIKDNNARRAIALLARAHWTEYARKLNSRDVLINNITGRLRLLGTLLAMADLLDISPVRARFFRSSHRLYSLPAKSLLHHTMHDFVRYFQFKRMSETGDLQFQLHWDDNTQETREMSDWVMSWFQSQWRQLQSTLYNESGATIRWHKPWAKIIFHRHEGQPRKLPPAAYLELQAERLEQERIDRDPLVQSFRDSIENKRARLFCFPKYLPMDGIKLSECFYAQARLISNCFVARVIVNPNYSFDLASIISEIAEQWDGQLPDEERGHAHLPASSNRKALTLLKSFVKKHDADSFVSIITIEEYKGHQLVALLKALLERSDSNQSGARVCLLLTREAKGPAGLQNVSIKPFNSSTFSRSDVERHLQNRWAFTEDEGRDIYDSLLKSGFAQKPTEIYDYIANHWKLFSGNYFIENEELPGLDG